MTAPTTESVQAELERKLADPVFRLAMEIFVGELFQQIATYHQAQVQKIVDWATERQLNRVRTGVAKRYLFERLTEVGKSYQGIQGKKEERPDVWNESLWERSSDGKFAGYNGIHAAKLTNRRWDGVPARYHGLYYNNENPDPRAVIEDALRFAAPEERNSHTSVFGRLNNPIPLPVTGDDYHRYKPVSQAQHRDDVRALSDELTYALADKTGKAEDKQRIQYIISSPDGAVRVVTPAAGTLPSMSLETGERVQFMTPVGPEKLVTTAGKAVNIGYVAGMTPEQAAKAGAVTGDVQRALSSTDWGNKMEASASALKTLSNDNQQVAQAHAVVQLLNLFGPQVSHAFQTKLTALGYRYMGQNAPKDAWGVAAQEGRQTDSQGKLESQRNYELKLGRELAGAIPNKMQYDLALKAGSTPPSKGYLLNRKGQVITQSVGYADDWYTPFDFKDLPRARGGSYVRTRGFGGITPEDLRTAMRAGVARVTVISNNGVFTLEFNPQTLHAGHRFGYAGNVLIRRYTRALEAIKGNRIKQGDGASASMRLDAVGYESAMRDLHMHNPYFIKNEEVSQPFWQHPGAFGHVYSDVTGPNAVDDGYVATGAGLHAAAAAHWHNGESRQAFTDGGKYNYHDADRARAEQLLRDRTDAVLRQQRINGGGIQYSDPQYNDERANAGIINVTRAYTPDERDHHWHDEDARAATESVHSLLRIYKANGVMPKNIDGFDALGEANRTLFPPNNGTINQRAYNDLVERVRTSQDFRQGLAAELHEVLGGRTLRGRVETPPGEVFAILRGETPDQREAATPFNSTDEYSAAVHSDGHAPILLHELAQSEHVQNWRQDQQALRENGDTPDIKRKANEELTGYKRYRESIKKLQEARTNNRGVLPRVENVLSSDELDHYHTWNPRMANMLVNGYASPTDEGLDEDTRRALASAPGPAGTVRRKKVDVPGVEAGLSPEAIADTHVTELQGDRLTPEQLRTEVQLLADRYDDLANTRQRKEKTERKAPNAHHSSDFSDVAAKLREQLEDL